MAHQFKGYQAIIADATGETDVARVNTIEDIMRNDIFHSTLDWQTRAQLARAARAQLARAAREAVAVMAEAARLGVAI